MNKTFSTRWTWIAVIAIALIFLTYGLAVLTPWGQAFENAALRGASELQPDFVADADDTLAAISYTSLALAIVAAFVIGLIRRRPRLAIAGAGTIIVSVVTAEVLKKFILPRPLLVETLTADSHNSFPSGHTTIAMSILMAALLLIPYRGRGWAMFFVFGWSAGIGAATIAAHWHRLSDTIAGSLLALAVASLFAAWLARHGDITPWTGRRFVFRTILASVWTVGGLISAGTGLLLLWLSATRNITTSADFPSIAYESTHVLALGISSLVGLLFWWTWHRLQIPRAG